MAEIVLDHVSKVYGTDGPSAVSDLNLNIQDGEFIVLVGPSGCGKTTALRMVAGLESITDGTVSIDDRVVNTVPPKERDIAMVFQNYALYPHMTVYDNMAFGLKLRKLSKEEIDRRVREAAKILGLDEFLDRKPKALSGGQRQRVAMGRAIVREPKAFLMDEPLSNLDAKLRVQMRSEIARIQHDLNVTTLYVTHDQVEAMTMGDRVAVIRKGVLQQVDAPQYLYDHPSNLFVAGFIGSPAMNMVEADLSRSNGALAVEFGGFTLAIPASVLSARAGPQGVRGEARRGGDPAGGHGGRVARGRRARRAAGPLAGDPPGGARGRRAGALRSQRPPSDDGGHEGAREGRGHGCPRGRGARRRTRRMDVPGAPEPEDERGKGQADRARCRLRADALLRPGVRRGDLRR